MLPTVSTCLFLDLFVFVRQSLFLNYTPEVRNEVKPIIFGYSYYSYQKKETLTVLLRISFCYFVNDLNRPLNVETFEQLLNAIYESPTMSTVNNSVIVAHRQEHHVTDSNHIACFRFHYHRAFYNGTGS